MEIKLNKWLVLSLIFFLLITNVEGQKKSVISMLDFNICGITYETSSPDNVKEKLGKPYKISEIPYNPNSEWGDGSLVLFYDSITFRYLVYDKPYIESIELKSSKYFIIMSIGKFSVNSTLKDLSEIFPDSYDYYIKKYSKQDKQEYQKFYVNLLYKNDESYFSGLMTIHLKNDIVKKIFLHLVEGN